MGRSTRRTCVSGQLLPRAGAGGGGAGTEPACTFCAAPPLSRMLPRGGAGAFHPLGPAHGGARTEQRRLREVQAEGSRSSKGGVIPPLGGSRGFWEEALES